MTYTSAFLGCGERAEIHALAYQQGVEDIRIRAICDVDHARLTAFGERFGIDARYHDVKQMLRSEKPDILHVVTRPDVRVDAIETAARRGVKGIIVEKPLALLPSHVRRIVDVARETGVKIAVNMQRRYFPSCRNLREIIADGRLGDLLFIRAVTKGNIMIMGPHMVDLLLFFLDEVSPERVWACARGVNGETSGHVAPANMLIRYVFPQRLVAYCEDADDCIGTPGETCYWQHLEIDFWGTKGRAWWTQNRDWGYSVDGDAEVHVAPTGWKANDIPSQAAFTRAMARWLDDDRAVHLNCLEHAVAGCEMILAALHSAHLGEEVPVPSHADDGLCEELIRELKTPTRMETSHA